MPAHTGRGRPRKYCSDRCANAAMYRMRPKGERYRAQIRSAVSAHLDRTYGPKVDGKGRRKRIAEHPCEVCGTPTKRPKTCSVNCAQRTDRAKRGWHRNGSIRRARVRAAVIEPVDRLVVFERDGWRCHICGELTDKDRLGQSHPAAPELEHKTPISRGGEHSYANTACAHRRCNLVKGTGGGIPIFQTA
jgi:5-methylcytosine-specific restriction endonuclease McrA